MMKLLLANPRCYCAGVDRAIQIVELALEQFGAPVYVRKEIVHNRHVVGWLHERGAVFVDELDEVPEGALGWVPQCIKRPSDGRCGLSMPRAR